MSGHEKTRIIGSASLTELGGPGPGALLEALLGGERSKPGSAPMASFDPGVHLTSRQLRRMSSLGALALVAASKALDRAGLDFEGPSHADDVDLMFASTHGATDYLWKFHEGWIKDGPSGASPILFTNGVTNAPAGHISLEFGIQGRALTFVGGPLSSFEALCEAVSIARDGSRIVIAGAAEEDSGALALGYRRVGEAGLCTLGFGPGALPLCGGAAVLVLSGNARSGTWIGKPCFAGSVAQAAGHALSDAELGPQDPDFVVCSFRGGEHDDEEASELEEAFQGRRRDLPIVAPMMNLGEGFALTAMLLPVCASEILEKGTLPPVPLQETRELPAPLSFSPEPLEGPFETALVTYREKDGSACAVVLGK